MSYMKEYIDKRLSIEGLVKELYGLISQYNKLRNSFLFIYCSAINKNIPYTALEQDDFYMFRDILHTIKGNNKNIDIYIETPGGSGEAAEEIVKYLHNNFESVNFLVSGEAKSAGTIMVLSGDEIMMTETGSLGPIDAQVVVGRYRQSAYDYIEWVNDVREKCAQGVPLNPFDARIISQITPGEINGIFHSLKFAEDLVTKWLVEYKFKNWDITETNKKNVTSSDRLRRAQEVANELTNHSKWRSHGRSLKIKDMDQIGVKIKNIDEDNALSDIVYRIQTICRLIFEMSNFYKLYIADGILLNKSAVPVNNIQQRSIMNKNDTDPIQINQSCQKCNESHSFYAKFISDKNIDDSLKQMGLIPFPQDNNFTCKKCGFIIDLSAIRNDIELKKGKKIIS